MTTPALARRNLSAAVVPLLLLALVLGATAAAVLAPPTAPKAQAATPAVSWSALPPTFQQPVQMLTARDGQNRYYVVQKTGTVRLVGRGVVQRTPYLDVRRLSFSDAGERGLLSIAFPPNFRTWPYVFSAHTDRAGNLVVSRWAAGRNTATTLNPSLRRTVLVVTHGPATNHNAGQLAFGRDGYLYVGTGDGGLSGDPYRAAQKVGDLRGKILRIDVRRACGGRLYCIPRSNPFYGRAGARGEVYALGMRNPWRFSVDRGTGDLWVGNVGQNKWESIVRIPYGTTFANAGWSRCEGTHRYYGPCPFRGYTPPVIEYCHADGVAGCNDTIGGDSVTGGVVYRGSRYPALRGQYVFGDYGNGNVWVGNTTRTKVRQAQRLPGVVAFGEDDAGNVYAVTIGSGRVWALRAS